MPAQEIVGFDSSQAQCFGDLLERQGVLAVAFRRACLRREARHVAAGWRQAFGDIIRNAEDHFRAPRLARRNPFFLFGIGSKYEAGVPGRERNLPLWEAKSVARRSHFLRKKSSS
jgi:hypothetical protein